MFKQVSINIILSVQTSKYGMSSSGRNPTLIGHKQFILNQCQFQSECWLTRSVTSNDFS